MTNILKWFNKKPAKNVDEIKPMRTIQIGTKLPFNEMADRQYPIPHFVEKKF